MMFMTSEELAFWRRLSTMAMFMPSFWAKARARATEPTSGETTMVPSVSSANFRLKCSTKRGLPRRLSTGMSKKPWIWAAWRSMVSTRSAPAEVSMLATSLAEMGSRGLAFRSCRA